MKNGSDLITVEEPTKMEPNKIKFCKKHNQVYYIKSEDENDDDHINCDACPIKNIEEEKRNLLKENIKYLEDLFKNTKDISNKFQKVYDEISEKKDAVKLQIQKMFTKLRNTLNNREDYLLLEIEQTFDDLYFSKDIVNENKKFPNKIKKIIEKGKLIDSKWTDNNIDTSINDCLNLDISVNEIKSIKTNISKFNDIKIDNIKIKFTPLENDINYFLEEIAKFGKISFNDFVFKKCPENISQERKYTISGEKQNILTKIGTDYCWMGVLCEKQLDPLKEKCAWKVKILRTYNYNIMIGIATIDFDVNSSSCDMNNNKGWYYYCINGSLYSGAPQFYQGKHTYVKPRNNEYKIIVNMKERTITFESDNEDKGESFTDIPLDKPLFPSILLKDINDSVEIIEC
jgi:hypothetical protein